MVIMLVYSKNTDGWITNIDMTKNNKKTNKHGGKHHNIKSASAWNETEQVTNHWSECKTRNVFFCFVSFFSYSFLFFNSSVKKSRFITKQRNHSTSTSITYYKDLHGKDAW